MHLRFSRKFAKLTAIGLCLILCLSTASCGDSDSSDSSSYSGNCEYQDNLSETANSFIGRCCIGQIRRQFPGEYLDATLADIQIAQRLDRRARTSYKLLNDQRFRKN